MPKALIVAWHEFITNFRRPTYLFFTFGLPLLTGSGLFILSFFGRQALSDVAARFDTLAKAPVGYVDLSGRFTTPISEGFVRYPDQQQAEEALRRGEIAAFFVIQPDYMETGRITAYGISQGFFNTTEVRTNQLRQFLLEHLLTDVPDPQLRARIKDPVNLTRVTLDTEGRVTQFNWLDILVPYAFSLLLIISIFTSSGFLLQGLSEEKETRVVEVLLSSVSAGQLMVGKILGLGALGLFQVLVWFGAGGALLGIAVMGLALMAGLHIPVRVIVLGIVYFLLGYTLYATLMAAAGSVATTFREGQQIGGIFSLSAAVPLMFSGFVFANPDSVFALALSYIPLTAPTMMMQRLALTRVPDSQVLISLVGLVLGIGIALWGTRKVFRMGLLMYGKRPSLKEIWRALRQA